MRQSLITTTAGSLPPAVDASDNDGDSLSDVQDPMDIVTTVDAGLGVQENSHGRLCVGLPLDPGNECLLLESGINECASKQMYLQQLYQVFQIWT